MEKYFIHLAYIGTSYHGWQRQKSVLSVQEVLEKCFSNYFKTPIKLHGCGRTDAGVHASQYYAHTFLPYLHKESLGILNLNLPSDISLFDIFKVNTSANAQKSATCRTYQYHFHLDKNPFLTPTSYWTRNQAFELDLLKRALSLLEGNLDFKAFCISPAQYVDTHCRIEEAFLKQISTSQFYIQISANRFLQQMMRMLIARLLAVAQERISFEDFSAALHQHKAFKYQESAPPQGLQLSKVSYDWEQLKKMN